MSKRKDRGADKAKSSGNAAQTEEDFVERGKQQSGRQRPGFHGSHFNSDQYKHGERDRYDAPQRDRYRYEANPMWHSGGRGGSGNPHAWGPAPDSGDHWGDWGSLYTPFEGSRQGPHWNNYMRVPAMGMQVPFYATNQYMNSFPPRQQFSAWQGKNSSREGRNRKNWPAHFEGVVNERLSDRSELHGPEAVRNAEACFQGDDESGRNMACHEDSYRRRGRPTAADGGEPSQTARSRKTGEEDTSPVRKDTLALSLKASQIIDKVLNKGKGTVTESSPAKSNTVYQSENPEETAEKDRGANLLIQAENLCRDIREKRQLARMDKESQEKRKSRDQQKKTDDRLSNLTQVSRSRMKGFINDENLLESQYQVHKHRKEVERSLGRGVVKKVSAASHSSSSNTRSSSTVVRPGVKVNIRPNLAGAIRIPRAQKKSNEVMDRKNLMRLVNSPRSRKERMQVAKILQSHGKSVRPSRPKLNLETVPDEHVDDFDEEGALSFDLESLPTEVQLQLAELFDNGFEAVDIDIASADSDTPMELEDLHAEEEALSDEESKPSESQGRDGQQIDISFSSKVTDPIIIFSDEMDKEAESAAVANQALDGRNIKPECTDMMPGSADFPQRHRPPGSMPKTQRYEKEDQYYHEMLDSIFSRPGKMRPQVYVKQEMDSSDTDEESPVYNPTFQDGQLPFQELSDDNDDNDDQDQEDGRENLKEPDLPRPVVSMSQPFCSSPIKNVQVCDLLKKYTRYMCVVIDEVKYFIFL